VWCLFSFKVLLIHRDEAGLRPDDFLIILSLAGLCITGRLLRTPLSRPFQIYLAYIFVSVVSALWNGSRGRVDTVTSLIFTARLVEYLVFYFVGYSLARSGFQFMRMVMIYFYMLCAIVPLQMIGLLPVPGHFTRERASGNTNGPYEFAVVCGFLLCFAAYRRRSAFLGSVALLGVFLSAARITLVAAALSLLQFGFYRSRSKGLTIAIAAVAVCLGGGIYLAQASGLIKLRAVERIENSKSYSLADLPMAYAETPVMTNAEEYHLGPFQDLNGLDLSDFSGDKSGLIRFTRWLTLLKSSFAHVDTILIGLGPSFGSAAVDGYYTRCLAETGVVGLIVFAAFLVALLTVRRRSSWDFRSYVQIMMISALFIDVFQSYKCMLLLWLWHGMTQYQASRPVDSSRLPLASLHLEKPGAEI
jgi:hypothetical protein